MAHRDEGTIARLGAVAAAAADGGGGGGRGRLHTAASCHPWEEERGEEPWEIAW